MSGPVEEADTGVLPASGLGVVVRENRTARVGTTDVMRALPTKGRRTIGAWCFVDMMLPGDELNPDPMEIGPHPHIGLHTVTWLLDGEAIHSDSLGTEQPIRPGQLNLMTAGHGIAHAELSAERGVLGLQMWIAQPELTRHGPSAFEHHGELLVVDVGIGTAKVLVGRLGDAESPARADTRLLGAQLDLGNGVFELRADSDFEYGLIPIEGRMKINDHIVEPGFLGILHPGQERLRIEAAGDDTRAMLIGGEPLESRVQMWWNFVARSRDELEQAWRDWDEDNTDRFPVVPSTLDRIEAPRPLWVRRDD